MFLIRLVFLSVVLIANQQSAILNVPSYQFGYGCGPTALAMVIGYYDNNGFPDLIKESSVVQSDEVNQLITKDLFSYMRTTVSGYSLGDNFGGAFSDYINKVYPQYDPGYERYWFGDGKEIWNILVHEIDNKRPMVFLVDTNGDGISDHFITVIGYQKNGKYAVFDTWSNAIRWIDYVPAAQGNHWGIWSAWSFFIIGDKTRPIQ